MYLCQDIGKNVASPVLKPILWISPLIFWVLRLFYVLSDVLLSKYEKKRCFGGFEIGFKAFVVLFWALWWLFCVNLTYRCKDMGKKVAFPALIPILGHLFIFLFTLVVILCQSDIPLRRYARKLSFLVLKTVLGHSPFFFGHFGGYFASIRHTFAKIQVKTLLFGVETRFTVFAIHFLSTLVVILSLSDVLLPKYWKTVTSPALKPFYRNSSFSFEHLVVFMRQFDLPPQGYGRKRCFADFETVFLAFTFLLTLWLLFYIYRKYRCQNTKKISFAGFKTGFKAFALFLSILVDILRLSEVHLPRYEWKRC